MSDNIIATARLTSKAQITIPKQVQKKLGVGPGDIIAFVEREDGRIYVTKAKVVIE